MNIIKQKFIRNDNIIKESKNEDIKPKDFNNNNIKGFKITKQNNNKTINRYGTPSNSKNIFNNYINSIKNDNCKILHSAKKDSYRNRNNHINDKMNVSDEKYQESICNKGKEKPIGKSISNINLISKLKQYKKDNLRINKSLLSKTINEFINIKFK